MHKLKIDVQVKGTITEEQFINIATSLNEAVYNYLNHLPVKQPQIIFNMDDLFEKAIPVA